MFDAEKQDVDIDFIDYVDESQLHFVMDMVTKDLSEPYSIFTYRYFLTRFPDLCILARHKKTNTPIGCVVGKIDKEDLILDGKTDTGDTGYIGMLAVHSDFRRKGIGQRLVHRVLQRMKDRGCTSVMLETERSNIAAQKLYEREGFVREELLVRYYLNWGDAYRLRLWF